MVEGGTSNLRVSPEIQHRQRLQVTMKMFVFLLLIACLRDASARTHSLKYFYTGSSGVPNFPEFVVVGMVDDVQMDHYDSNSMNATPKQDWMKEATADDPQYWERETQKRAGWQEGFKVDIETLRRRFNQTAGVHIYQVMYGCEWDDETPETNGFDQQGYDGEDFISFDLKTETWIAAKQQAVFTKQKWDDDKANIAYLKNYYTQICIEWLKKYVDHGRNSLMRTDLPTVSLLQKSPSAPVRCHATGFYPDRATLVWRKGEEELHEGVDLGETLPNPDGTFQMSADLNVASVPPEDWRRYKCVFQLSGVKKPIVTTLDKDQIRTNWGRNDVTDNPSNMAVIVAAVAVVLVVVLVGVVGFFVYRQRNAKRAPSPVNNREVMEQLNPPRDSPAA